MNTFCRPLGLMIVLTGSVCAVAQINVGPANGIGAGPYSSIAGGNYNTNKSSHAIIAGGYLNLLDTNASFGAIGGGYGNTINGSYVLSSVIAGGEVNAISAGWSTVSGGYGNVVPGQAAFIGGGSENNAGGEQSVIAGGSLNVTSARWTTIGGGTINTVTGEFSTIAGGVINVATGESSTVGGGQQHTAGGTASTVSGGQENRATAAYASVPGGWGAVASHYGQVAHASGRFGSYFDEIGDAQSSMFVLRATSNSTNKVELFLDGASQRLTLATNSTWLFDMLLVARSSTGNSSGWQVRGVIENVNGTVAKVGSFTKTAIGEDVTAWALDINSDNVNKCLSVKATGDSSNIRWVATVRTSEVAY